MLRPDESRTALVRLQLSSLVFSGDLQSVMTLKGGPPGGPLGPAGPNGAMGGLTGLGKNVGRHGRVLGGNEFGPNRAEGDYDTEWVRLNANRDLAGLTVAQQVYPIRAAEIAATFPYKKEVEEFQKKLGLQSSSDVLAEQAGVTKDGLPLAAFRFLGVAVQRRELDMQGQPIGADAGWQPLDAGGDYTALLALAGGRMKADDPELAAVEFPGLVMNKLPAFGDRRAPPVDDYPKIELEMAKLAETLRVLRAVPGGADIARPGSSQEPGNAFDPASAGPVGPLPGGPVPGDLRPPRGGLPPGGADLVLPEHCLIRVFDFTVEPGKTYEYRLQVRMANPNRGRKDVIAPDGPEQPELTPRDWYVLPDKLTVPPDLYFYAVDQAALDALDGKDKNLQGPREPKLPVQQVKASTQTVLQIQKWMDFLPLKNHAELAIGDWVIAERVVATRGEPIGRSRVEAPYWRKQQDRFTMAVDQPLKPSGKKYAPSVEAPFVPEGEEPILVDFSGGDVAYVPTLDPRRWRFSSPRRMASCWPTAPRRMRPIPTASSGWRGSATGFGR